MGDWNLPPPRHSDHLFSAFCFFARVAARSVQMRFCVFVCKIGLITTSAWIDGGHGPIAPHLSLLVITWPVSHLLLPRWIPEQEFHVKSGGGGGGGDGGGTGCGRSGGWGHQRI